MNYVKSMTVLVLVFAVCMGTAFAQKRSSKKKKVTVFVEQNDGCSHGIAVSAESWGDRHLCTDNPDGAANHLQNYVGSSVEVEAKFSFEGDPKATAPVAIVKVFKVGREKVYDPCAIHKLGLFAGMMMAANGADPETAASLAIDPSCGADGGDNAEDQ
jgi:hypothetical protein